MESLEMRYAPTIMPICEACEQSEDFNLLTKNCERCKNLYCPHFASKIDDNYCGNCMTDVQLEVYQKRDFKSIKINGSDFYFAQRSVRDMTDTQLEVKIEYFDAMLSALRLEKEERKVERMSRLAKTKLVAVRPPTQQQAVAKPKATAKGSLDIAAALTVLWGRAPTQQEIENIMKASGK